MQRSFASRDSVEGAFNSTRLFCSVPFDREMQAENRPKASRGWKTKTACIVSRSVVSTKRRRFRCYLAAQECPECLLNTCIQWAFIRSSLIAGWLLLGRAAFYRRFVNASITYNFLKRRKNKATSASLFSGFAGCTDKRCRAHSGSEWPFACDHYSVLILWRINIVYGHH